MPCSLLGKPSIPQVARYAWDFLRVRALGLYHVAELSSRKIQTTSAIPGNPEDLQWSRKWLRKEKEHQSTQQPDHLTRQPGRDEPFDCLRMKAASKQDGEQRKKLHLVLFVSSHGGSASTSSPAFMVRQHLWQVTHPSDSKVLYSSSEIEASQAGLAMGVHVNGCGCDPPG